MALKISQLPNAPALSGDELFEIAESGSSRSVPASGISTYIGAEGYSKTSYVDTRIASVSAAADQAFTNELYVDTQIASVSAAADQAFTNELYVDTQIEPVSAAANWKYAPIVTTTSGTSVTLTTAIPSGAVDIEIIFNGVSTNTANQPPILQLGDAGGFEITGYVGMARASNAETAVTDSFRPFRASVYTAAMVVYGTMKLQRWDRSLHTWIANSLCHSATILSIFSGIKTTSEVLTSLRLTTPGGAATFDAGSVRVRWR